MVLQYCYSPTLKKMEVCWFTVHLSCPSVHCSLHPFLIKFFVKDFSTTMQASMIIFDIQIDDDMYCGKVSPLILPCIFPFFFPYFEERKFLSEISLESCKLELSYAC